MTPARLFAAQEATWPPAAKTRLGPVTIREGQGGGQRVSAATVEGPVSEGDITAAEVAMARLGQVPLFMIRPGDEALDEVLDARGYRVVDPVCVLAAPVETVAQEPPPVTAFTVWQPLAIMEEIWDACGIGPARRAVMARSTAPKTAVLGRQSDRPAGAGFAAIHDGLCYVHALAVADSHRRKGTAINMMRALAVWAQDQGASEIVALVTEDNAPARALYASLGLQNVGHYHYRAKEPHKV
ncbi:Acetyltransferase (GNAT) family protein [Rhodovulum sp. ES.010]|uniref:GNAT family N-acetyltransferase n=1 Tax=Rhodovulum sp. ES.010 TaxID=1882821 RepID=UPI0009293B1C|nr:GNAT family N-acetyltransferase [Rhodovulum sp. ES.010]SIO51837.1 Acetyltransferase (GNAT) family protein [Rhodovulum sp. ES.010]